MAIYGNTISFGGGGGSNDTLPPLLDNFKATRLEGGLVPPVSNAVAFKDIPDGSKIKLVKGNNISGTVTYGTTTDLNHRIVFDSNDWTRKRFQLENDRGHSNISVSDIDQWLNATKASNWWREGGERDLNRTPPDYANDEGFLYQLGITDELLAQNFNNIQINSESTAKVALPWRVSFSEDIPYTFFKDVTFLDVADYASLYGNSGNDVLPYNKPQTKAPPQLTLYNVTAKIHPMMEPKPETKVALDVDGSYFMFENQAGGIILSADKMPVSRANALAGAVWVYGEHEPKNVNDGTKINLTREEIVLPEEGDTDIPPISYTELERPTSTKTWTATEDGYYKFVGVAGAGRSGTARRIAGASYNVSGGSGGSGGIVASVFKLKRGESVSLTVTGGDVTISYGSETANATHGQDGGSSSSEPDNKVKPGIHGKPGTATGGNLANINGEPGSPGKMLEGNKATIVRGGETVYEKHISRGGYAQSTRQEGDMVPADRGTTAYIAVLKGNDLSNEALNFTAKASKTIADLPSKSKVKLGRYGDADLQWLVSRNAENKLILVLDSNSISALGNKILDAAEPSNYDSDRRNYGNNRYIYTNLHQWLNAEKGANQWFVKAHNADTPPNYQNQAGFLNGWKKEELDLLELAEWTVTKSGTDGSGKETFRSRVVLPSTTEMGFSSEGGGSKLDIFNSNSDRSASATYWTRTPYPTSPCINYQVKSDGTLYTGGYNNYDGAIRPICAIPASTLVSDTTDSDGCYTIQFIPPAQKTFTWYINKDLYARQFTYNSKKQYQTMLEGATTELLLGEVPLPVSNLAISENAGASPTLSWKNPTDKNYHETVVVQKEGSTPPRSTDDGIEVYRGNGESVTVKDLQSTVDYSFGVFTLSPYGNYGEPSTISYRYDFPSEPTDYLDCAEISETTEYEIPEDGWFRIDVISAGGSGGNSPKDPPGSNYGDWATPGGGASGSHARSEIALYKGDKLSIQFTGGITVNNNERSINIQVVNGAAGNNPINNETPGTGGQPGNASGGNKQNENGTRGNSGNTKRVDSYKGEIYGGTGAARKTITITETKSYDTYGGNGSGADDIRESSCHIIMETAGNSAKVFISRGNTNIPSPQ